MKNEYIVTPDDYCNVTNITLTHNNYRIYLNHSIESNMYYIKLFNILRDSKPTDTVEIIINNFGGYLSTAVQIVNAIRSCKAPVKTILCGMGCSAGSIIFMAGKYKEVDEHVNFMVHYYSGNSYGKGNEIESRTEFSKKFIHDFYRDVYKDVLTKDELKRVFAGEDFWFDSKELKKRLKL